MIYPVRPQTAMSLSASCVLRHTFTATCLFETSHGADIVPGSWGRRQSFLRGLPSRSIRRLQLLKISVEQGIR
jgi:hypothetical protein